LGGLSPIGRIFAHWAFFFKLGSFLEIFEVAKIHGLKISGSADWANFCLLGEFSLIGRIFAYWAVVFFGQFSENYRSSTNSLLDLRYDL
jgi:hypothetical protein